MTSRHPKTKVAGILCLHRITDRRLKDAPPTRLLKDLCGDTEVDATKQVALKQVALVTTHWDKIGEAIREAEGRKRERELIQMTWASLSAMGAKMERFNKTEEAARKIVNRLLT